MKKIIYPKAYIITDGNKLFGQISGYIHLYRTRKHAQQIVDFEMSKPLKIWEKEPRCKLIVMGVFIVPEHHAKQIGQGED